MWWDWDSDGPRDLEKGCFLKPLFPPFRRVLVVEFDSQSLDNLLHPPDVCVPGHLEAVDVPMCYGALLCTKIGDLTGELHERKQL
jgi:hypothetical protein